MLRDLKVSEILFQVTIAKYFTEYFTSYYSSLLSLGVKKTVFIQRNSIYGGSLFRGFTVLNNKCRLPAVLRFIYS